MLYRSVAGRLGAEMPTDIEAWLTFLIESLRAMPHARVRALLFEGVSLKGLRFAALDADAAPPAAAWEAFRETVLRYTRGEAISEIGAYATGADLPLDQARTVGSKPIPKVLSFLQQMAYQLSMAAGGLTALWLVGDERAQMDEQAAAWALAPEARAPLNLLPLAVRCGASTRSSLAWYRFGMRHRVVAHVFARSFPLPEDVQDDIAVRTWIHEKRRGWLECGIVADGLPNAGFARALRRVANFEGV